MTDLEFAGRVFQCVRSAGGSSDLMERCRQNIIKAQAALRQVAELEDVEKDALDVSANQDKKQSWNLHINDLEDRVDSDRAKIKRLNMSIDCLRQGERHVEERFDLVADEIRGIKERLVVLESGRDARETYEAEQRERGPSPYDAVGPLDAGGLVSP